MQAQLRDVTPARVVPDDNAAHAALGVRPRFQKNRLCPPELAAGKKYQHHIQALPVGDRGGLFHVQSGINDGLLHCACSGLAIMQS